MPIRTAAHSIEIESYVETHLVQQQPGLIHARENSLKHGIPTIAVSTVQGKFLSLLTSLSGAQNVLEIGTLGGYSSIWFAQTTKARGGKLTSIEIDSSRREVALQNLQVAGINVPTEAEILLGAALDVLPKLAEEISAGTRPKFDFVFIDADWENQWRYFDLAVGLSKGKGSVIYVDNVVKEILESGIVGPEKRNETVTPLVEKVGQDGRVEAVVMQTIGAKQHDGFLMAVVK
ncbi:O-methyltransferase [Talaromyces proteolyticus]|uniref:O-methyltransferase n=1 Tax=Talaromyces proteolyticus TaxID=1131652 RepID=A0AAD4Q4P0_9EURO|nr:O-methyltransferase [Talaromyces proteolyticus]KAH8703461.1 O-methyltransferase [Talaromyces proteolyticus]